MMKDQTSRNDDLHDRMIDFAVRVLNAVESLPNSRVGNQVASQLIRSGTSLAPNDGEAQSAESRKDFSSLGNFTIGNSLLDIGYSHSTSSSQAKCVISPIARLTNLRELVLTLVDRPTPEEIADIRKALPNCRVVTLPGPSR